jgi:2-polyprenyl-3-methyl-5-hydroxy-6-metoxy-1,4-benzoquinol methylase
MNKLVRKAARRAWMKYAMRGVGAADNFERLDVAYALPDPWNLDSELERARFEATDALIAREFGRLGSVLEIGCGEGHQTAHLARNADSVFGLDVSARAIERARRRVPSAQFAVSDLAGQPWGESHGRFDLVTAFEVLYYIRDPDETLRRMSSLGKACVVTIFAPAARRLGDRLHAIEGARRDWFHHGGTVWLACWWHNPEAHA